MSVYYVKGGAPAGQPGAIEKVINEQGTVVFDNLATKAVKVAGWSQLAHVQKFKNIVEGSGQHGGER